MNLTYIITKSKLLCKLTEMFPYIKILALFMEWNVGEVGLFKCLYVTMAVSIHTKICARQSISFLVFNISIIVSIS